MARRLVIFGCGNNIYPLSRCSVGSYFVDKLAQRYNFKFTYKPLLHSEIFEGQNLVLIKPKTFDVKRNHLAISSVLNHYGSSRAIFALHDLETEFGQFRIGEKMNLIGNLAMETPPENATLFGIGVAPSGGYFDAHYRMEKTTGQMMQFFQLNRFSPDEQTVIDRLCDQAEDLLPHLDNATSEGLYSIS